MTTSFNLLYGGLTLLALVIMFMAFAAQNETRDEKETANDEIDPREWWRFF